MRKLINNMNYQRQTDLPYPQPWEWVKDNIEFLDKECFYVDVGANDGLIVSNTAYFDLDLNWKGICIEPHPRAFFELIKNRPNAINLNICISEEERIVDFISISGYSEMLSGISQFYDDQHLKRIDNDILIKGGSKETLKIQSFPLTKILNKYGVKKVDYLSIDTEGSELSVLKSIDFLNFDIRILSCERGYSNKEKIDYLKQFNYELVINVSGDDIFVKV